MDISEEMLRAYTQSLKAIEEKAAFTQSRVAYVLDAQVGLDEEEYKAALKRLSATVADNYAKAAARVSARFANAIYEADTGESGTFDIAHINAQEAIEHGIKWSDTPEKVTAKTLLFVRSLVRRGARNTVIHAVAGTKGKWARVPQGLTTCAFCIILASHGFYYHSKETAGGVDPSRFHNDCDCLVVPSWSDNCSVAGYEPKALEEKYKQAKAAIGGNTDLNKVTAKMRRMYGVK